MPSSDERLRAKFMINGSDGILECENIIKKHGGKIIKGMIEYPSNNPLTGTPDWKYIITIEDGNNLNDAINYLIWEWDYGLK